MQGAARLLSAAIEHHEAGRLEAAEKLYLDVLDTEPRQADALHLWGVLAHQVGRNAEAIERIEQAISHNPHNSIYYSNLGEALKASGQMEAAEQAYRKATQLQPGNLSAWISLGSLLQDHGRDREAIGCYETVIQRDPSQYQALNNLGVVYLEQQRFSDAEGVLRRAIRQTPQKAEAHFNLGNVFLQTHNFQEAERCYRKALEIHPAYAKAYNGLGLIRKQQAELEAAIACYRQAIEADPRYAISYNNLGAAQTELNLLSQATESCQQAIRLNPGYFQAINNLGVACQKLGRLDLAQDAFRRAIQTAPFFFQAHSNLLFSLNHDPAKSLQEILQQHQFFGEQIKKKISQERLSLPQNRETTAGDLSAPLENTAVAARRLRVGYVSPDFRNHVVAQFIEPVLANHRHSEYEVFAYAEVNRPDEVTERLQGYCDHWRNSCSLSDRDLAVQIRNDQIDILIDLAGHTSGTRLGCFAYRAAPVQATYLGYPNTTGLAEMDYRITDVYTDPAGHEDYYVEQLVRLDDGFLCFAPVGSPPVERLPAWKNRTITFGSFNRLEKLNPTVIELWAHILKQVPDSRLLLKAPALDDLQARDHFWELFSRHGVSKDRVELRGFVPTPDGHLATYHEIDIALDPFPYSGTTTTCEALWMGVPVITLNRGMHAARVSASLLHRVCLDHWIAEDLEQYVQIAEVAARERESLAELRATLRERVKRSSLYDAQRLTHNLEQAYRSMWYCWCDRQQER